jgi:hypothetical protein
MGLNKLVQIVILFLCNSSLFGQPKFDGPRQIEPGELARISIEGIKGLNDPKIDCVPKNDSWEAMQRLDGSPVILFYTRKEGTYTFIVVGNKDNKTYFDVFTVIVGKPLPPGPTPGPPDGKYTSQLRSQYLVSPDNTSLIKLIAVYQSMGNRAAQVENYKQLSDALASATKTAIGEVTLRGVRDSVALILQNDLANRNATKYDPVAASAIFKELANSLSPLLEK